MRAAERVSLMPGSCWPGAEGHRSKVAWPGCHFEDSLAAAVTHILSDVGAWQSQGRYQNSTWMRFEFTSLGRWLGT